MDGVDSIEYIISKNIPGALVECGCGNGNFQILWIRELQKRQALRDIYMYDTFAGLTEPCELDYTVPDSTQYTMNKDQVKETWSSQIQNAESNGWCNWSLEYVKRTLEEYKYPNEYLHYIVGDVRKTLLNEENIPKEIAILRLDTDWYDSSKLELQKMFPYVVSGGLVIFDDYNHWNGQRVATDEFFKEIGQQYQFVHLGKTAAMIKR